MVRQYATETGISASELVRVATAAYITMARGGSTMGPFR